MKALIALAIVITTFAIATPTATAPPSPQSSPQLVRINIAIFSFNCSKIAQQFVYSVRPTDADGVDHAITPVKDAEGLYHITLSTPPGHYDLHLDARPAGGVESDASISCETHLWFTVLPDHERHLVAVLGQNLWPHSNCSIAGALPAEGLDVAFVLPKGQMMLNTTVGGLMGRASDDIDYDVVVDGSAYYVEHVAAETFELRIGDARIPIDVSKIFPNRYCLGEFVRDVTTQDLKTAFPPVMLTE